MLLCILIYETKRRDGYVGGVTHIYKLYFDGRSDFERTWDQSARESLFESLRQWNYRMVVTVGSTSIQPWDYKEIVDSFTRNMRSIRGEFRRIEQRYQRWIAEQAATLVIKPKKLSTAPKSAQEIFKNLSPKPSDGQK